VVDELGVEVAFGEVVGLFASPTLLVEGTDVAGRSPGEHPACRLDVPTYQQLRAALSAYADPQAEP
jgi:hypothetical protein